MADTLSHMKSLAHAAAEALRSSESRDVYLKPVHAARALSMSPIENIMGEALVCCSALNDRVAPKVISPGEAFHGDERLLIAPQHTIGFYYVDFAIIDQKHNRRLVVECDGHEFHDKSVTQATSDKARDRFLLRQGWPVMHFSGTEISRQIDLCLKEIVEYLTGAANV